MKSIRSISILVGVGLQFTGAIASAQQSVCSPDTTGKKPDPFSFANFSWLNGNSRTTDSPISTAYFTGEFRADVTYIGSFNHPSDHTLVGTSESGSLMESRLVAIPLGPEPFFALR